MYDAVILAGIALIAGFVYATIQYLGLFMVFPVWIGVRRYLHYCLVTSIGFGFLLSDGGWPAEIFGDGVAAAGFVNLVALPTQRENSRKYGSKTKAQYSSSNEEKASSIVLGLGWLITTALVVISTGFYRTAAFYILTAVAFAGLVIAAWYRAKDKCG